MKSVTPRASLFIAPLILLLSALPSPGASLGVRDEAHFFTSDAINQANQIIHQIDARHHRDVLIETIPSVPQDMAEQEQSLGKDAFFSQWADQRASQEGVSGVYVLICKNPPHLQAAVGNTTAERLFTDSDRDDLVRRMLASFKKKDYDQGLLNGVRFIQQQMDAHVSSSGSAAQNSGYGAPVGPYGSPPGRSNPPRGDLGWGFGSIACVIVAVILGIILIRGIMGRTGGTYGAPGGYYPPGGGAYPPGAGYPPPGYGGGYGGGGSGFGRGFLGGLLGGALGGYAADRWLDRNQSQGGGYSPQMPPTAGGDTGDYNPGPDTSFSSSGGDFGSSDSGGGGGGDFSSGGGGDFGGGGDGGGGGGDSGGGGGGDF